MNVPKLRFSEFEEEWDKITLGDIISEYNADDVIQAALLDMNHRIE